MGRAFIKAGPALQDGERVWEEVFIGYEHTVDDDGTVHLILDDAGEPVPTRYRVPVGMSLATAWRAHERVNAILAGQGISLVDVAEGNQTEYMQANILIALCDAQLGDGVMHRVANDPTVSLADAEEFLQYLTTAWGFDELVAQMYPGDLGKD